MRFTDHAGAPTLHCMFSRYATKEDKHQCLRKTCYIVSYRYSLCAKYHRNSLTEAGLHSIITLWLDVQD